MATVRLFWDGVFTGLSLSSFYSVWQYNDNFTRDTSYRKGFVGAIPFYMGNVWQKFHSSKLSK